MNMMNDEQVRRFINNLCNYSEGKEVELPTELEKALWIGILPSLKINDAKYEKVVERNRKNGQLGGAPLGNQNARKDETTQNNPNNPISDKREVIIDNSKVVNDNCKITKDDWQEVDCEISNLRNDKPLHLEAPIENLDNQIVQIGSNQSLPTNSPQEKRPPTNLLLEVVQSMDTNHQIPEIFYEVVQKKEEEGWMKLAPKEAMIFIDNRNLFNNFLASNPLYEGVKLA